MTIIIVASVNAYSPAVSTFLESSYERSVDSLVVVSVTVLVCVGKRSSGGIAAIVTEGLVSNPLHRKRYGRGRPAIVLRPGESENPHYKGWQTKEVRRNKTIECGRKADEKQKTLDRRGSGSNPK